MRIPGLAGWLVFSLLNIIASSYHCIFWALDGHPVVEKLPRRFWEMVIEQCPNLVSLTIGGCSPSPRHFDVRHVMAGRWRRLKKLTLGDTAVLPEDHKQESEHCAALDKFLGAHPSLREIAFKHPGSAKFPPLLTFPRSAFLESFTGPPRYIKSLPHPKRLKRLAITTLHHVHSSFSPTCTMLLSLPSLESLSIWIDLTFASRNVPRSDGNIFRSLLSSCPRLVHLEVLCFTRPTFPVVRKFNQPLF